MLKNKLKSFRYAEWATGIIILSVVSLLVIASNTHKNPNIHNSVGVNEQINYQGRLLTNTGAVVADGTYNMEFKIYQDGDGVLGGGDETLKWTESRTSGNKVTVKNGYFSVYLGSVTAFASNINWNQDTLWLSINIGGTGSPSWDGEMSPFTRFSSTPYALNSKTLNGLASGNFVQLAQGTQTDGSSSNASISINKTAGTANLLELLRGGSNVFTVSNGGATTLQNSTDSTSALQVKNVAGDILLKVDTSTTENLLSNGQFETNTTGWAAKGSSTVTHTTSQKYIGVGAMQVANTAANAGAKFDYALNSQTLYTLTMYVKSSVTTASTSTINIGRTEDGSTDSDCATAQTITGGGWTRLTCVFTTANVTGTNSIYIKQTDSTTRTLYIDSVELQTSTNLIANPDLETDISNWGSYGGGALSHNTSEAYTGSASVQVDTSTSGSSEGATVAPTVQPNTTYTASFWVKTDAATVGTKAITILKRLDSVDAGAGTSCGSTSVSPGVWTNVRCTFTIGSSKNSSPFLSVNTTDDGVTPITYYIDTANLAITKYNSSDFGRISLNAALDSPLTLRTLQDSTTAFQVQQQNGNNILTADTANGFVGIGTASPVKTLEVDGKTLIRATSTDTDTFQVVSAATIGATNSVAFNVAASSRAVSVGLASNTANASLSVYGTQLINTKSNSANALRITDSSGIAALTFATTNGNRRLTIGGTGANNDGKLTVASSSGTSVIDFDSASGGSAVFNTDYFEVLGQTSGISMIYADGVNGFVGIGGNPTPAYALDVIGDTNTSGSYLIGGLDINTAGTLTNVAYENQANTFTSSNTFNNTVTATGGISFTPAGTSDIVFTLDDDSNFIINDGITNTGSIFAINTTLGNDSDADTVAALSINVTSANTGDADILTGLNIANLTSADAAVREEAITVGTGWDYDLALNDTTPTVRLGATDGTAVFNITDSCSSSCVNGGTTPNSLFELRDIGTNFGGLISSGGFLGTNSYMSQEFAADTLASGTADSAAVGDDGNWYVDLSTAASTESFSQTDSTGGFVRMTTGTTSGRGILLGFGAAQNNLSLGFAKANLPVLQMKVRTNINNATNDLFWGFMDTAAAPTTNDSKPTNGIYFWNNNAGGAWQGVVRSGGADVGTVTCSGSVSTTQFAVGRIQVESASSVRFLIDNDASDGVSMSDCGTVSGANPAGSLGIAAYTVHTEATGRNFDVDYARVWQDDVNDASETALNNEEPQFSPTTNEENNNVEEQNNAQSFTVESINAQTVTVELNLFVNGDTTLDGALTVQGGAIFNGEAIFNKLATFVDKVLFQKDVTFAGRTSFNSDTGGYAKIATGQTQVHVTFDKPYAQPPVVTLTVKNGQFVQYAYTDLTPQGFTIILSQPASADVEFSWTALQIDGAKVATN